MNKVICMYIKGTDYNPMKKWNSIEEFKLALEMNDNIPANDTIIAETWIDDNLVNTNSTFKQVVEQLKLVFDF